MDSRDARISFVGHGVLVAASAIFGVSPPVWKLRLLDFLDIRCLERKDSKLKRKPLQLADATKIARFGTNPGNAIVCRPGVTLADVLVSLGIIGLLVSLLLPSVQSARESARVVTCKNHLRQLAMATHSFESSHAHFPPTSTTWFQPSGRLAAISPFVHLMGHLELGDLNETEFDDGTNPAWMNSPLVHRSPRNEELNRTRFPVLLCPSDPAANRGVNFRCNLGISTGLFSPQRSVYGERIAEGGAFVHGRSVKVGEFQDGLSSTALYSERVQGDENGGHFSPFQDLFSDQRMRQGTENVRHGCRTFASLTPESEFSFAGKDWLLGGWLHTWYSHVAPPNWTVPDCGLGPGIIDGGEVVVSARSYHPNRVNVAFADGAVREVSNSIDQKVWTAMGTRSGSD